MAVAHESVVSADLIDVISSFGRPLIPTIRPFLACLIAQVGLVIDLLQYLLVLAAHVFVTVSQLLLAVIAVRSLARILLVVFVAKDLLRLLVIYYVDLISDYEGRLLLVLGIAYLDVASFLLHLEALASSAEVVLALVHVPLQEICGAVDLIVAGLPLQFGLGARGSESSVGGVVDVECLQKLVFSVEADLSLTSGCYLV